MKPLAEPVADLETRLARRALYVDVLAPLWRSASDGATRSERRRARRRAQRQVLAYLANEFGLPAVHEHMVDWFDLDACRHSREILSNLTYPQIRDWCMERSRQMEAA